MEHVEPESRERSGNNFLGIKIPGFARIGMVKGDGIIKTKDFPIENIGQVRFGMAGHLHIRQGDEESLTIEADENLFEYIDVENQNGLLRLTWQHGVYLRPTKPIQVHLQVRSIEKLVFSGSGEMHMEPVEFENFSLNLSGSGKMYTKNIECDTLFLKIGGSGDIYNHAFSGKEMQIRISGSGNVQSENVQAENISSKISGVGKARLTGAVKHQEIKIGGSGTCLASTLQSTTTDIIIGGSGKADVSVSSKLDVKISGSGRIRYLGEPLIRTRKSGVGKIEALQDAG